MHIVGIIAGRGQHRAQEGEHQPAQQAREVDEEFHRAFGAVDGGEGGKVVETLLKGWMYEDGKVVRYAKVKVYKKI
mgnify:CR=1 FL=1